MSMDEITAILSKSSIDAGHETARPGQSRVNACAARPSALASKRSGFDVNTTPKAYLVTGQGADERRIPIDDSLVVGRGVGCDLVLRDLAASRRHLQIDGHDGDYRCRDLGSSNGTRVNGRPVTSCRLDHGDEIRVGATALKFILEDRSEPPPVEKTVFLQTIIDASGREQAPPSTRSKELLEAAYTLMNSMASTFDSCELVDHILETTMHAVHAQRGAVLFAGEDHRLEPCAECGRVHTIRERERQLVNLDEIEISESVARRVLVDGEHVLYQSARANSGIDSTKSIAALRLTSILCVPIRTQNSILGILYIDTDQSNHEYSEDDMLLAAAAGNSAGLALDNSRIYKDLLERQRTDQDIEAAWTIQEGFLVHDWPTDDPRIEVFGLTRPARVVGGDFYDFARLDEDHVGMLIGDVSGKGVPAALTMALLLAEFRMCATGAESTAEVMRRLNERMVARSRRGTFCTAALVALNLRTGHCMAANAGHLPMLRISGGRVSTWLPASGPPLGIVMEADWSDVETVLGAGETLLLYTDGITEARDGSAGPDARHEDEEYGTDGLCSAASGNAGRGPRELIEAILADVDEYCSPMAPHDDCTMIALKYNGHA
jgi:serine phosphatase RsbU (regulator of sigma subunit)/pSer/pThr/pTyr-binding forkhead associated (FHA) protein